MKTVLMTCLALVVTACGGGGEGSRDFPARDLPPPTGQSQTPERPSNSVPPLSSQAPSTNSQLPPSSDQLAGPGVTCAAVIAALQRAGCRISSNDAQECEAYTVTSAPCFQQVQDLFSCILVNPVCNTDGDLAGGVCTEQLQVVDACLEAIESPPPGQDCRPANNCRGCGNECDSCRCAVEATPDLGLECDAFC